MDIANLLKNCPVLILVLLEDGIGECMLFPSKENRDVLILVLLEDGIGVPIKKAKWKTTIVLILVLLEDGIGEQIFQFSENQQLTIRNHRLFSFSLRFLYL